MVDYQFLALVAVAFAVMTGGSVLPVLAVTALVAIVLVGYEASVRRYRRRHPRPAGPGVAARPTDPEVTRWMTVMDRVLRSHD